MALTTLVGTDSTYAGPFAGNETLTDGLKFWKFTAAATGPIERIQLHTRASPTLTAVSLGIFTDDAGVPGTLIDQAAATGVIDATFDPWYLDAEFTPFIDVVAGTDYWLAVQATGGLVYRRAVASGGSAGVPSSGAITDSPAGGFGTSTPTGPIVFWGEGDVVPVFASDGSDAAFEVRITPLFKPIEGLESTFEVANDDASIIAIDEADTILVTQYSDLKVEHSHNEGRSGSVTISMHDPILDTPPFAIEEFACALWIGFKRPGEPFSEGILYGQCNVSDNYDDTATVVLEAQDPYVGKTTHHYIRRGDVALNVDAERGRVNADVFGISAILEAARNTDEQMARQMPVLGLGEQYDPSFPDGPPFDFERSQEVADLISQIQKHDLGPDLDIVPSWGWPTQRYATMRMYLPPGDPAAPDPGQLGRNLDPADPDAPATGEVILERGIGLSNLLACNRHPELPATHVHVLDESGKYRRSAVDVASSAKVGAFVNWIATTLTIRRPHKADDGSTVSADTDVLQALADAHIKAYGKPPPFVTMTVMAPDAPGVPLYGHPDWPAAMGVVASSSWYIGDYVRVRASQGYRSFSELMRIVKATFTMAGSNGIPRVDIEAIPAIGGTPGAGSSGETGS